jgi:hypothetical protein
MFYGLTKDFIHYYMWSWDEIQCLLQRFKTLNSSDYTSQLYMYQINCDFFILEACNKTFDNHNTFPCILFLCV